MKRISVTLLLLTACGAADETLSRFDVARIRVAAAKSTILPTPTPFYVKPNPTPEPNLIVETETATSHQFPTEALIEPTTLPLPTQTATPADAPTAIPTNTDVPTLAPTVVPTFAPTILPTVVPVIPTNAPTVTPTLEPTLEPTLTPTAEPTFPPNTIVGLPDGWLSPGTVSDSEPPAGYRLPTLAELVTERDHLDGQVVLVWVDPEGQTLMACAHPGVYYDVALNTTLQCPATMPEVIWLKI